jgi:hypothetical protein
MHRTTLTRAPRILLGALALYAAPAAAQPATYAAQAGAVFESYTFQQPELLGVRRISLATLPLEARTRLSSRLELSLRSAYANGSLERDDGTTATLSGPTDTELRAGFSMRDDRVRLSVGYVLPTGIARQSQTEAEVASLIAADLIPFRISSWGNGGGFTVGSSIAVPVGGFGVGASVGYARARAFQPATEEEFTYQPGDALLVRVAADRAIGSSSKAALLFNLQHYQNDALAGSSYLRPGSRYEVIGSYAFAAGDAAQGMGYAGLSHRQAGRFELDGRELPAQDLLLVGGGMRIRTDRAVFVPSVDTRIFRRSNGIDQGYLVSVGSALELPLGQATLIPAIRSRVGKVLRWQDAESSVRGAEISLSLRLGTLR